MVMLSGCDRVRQNDPESGERQTATHIDSDRWMRDLLDSYRQTAETDPFLGTENLHRAREMLKILQHVEGPDRLIPLHEQIIQSTLRLGNVEEAIEHVRRAESLMESPDTNISEASRTAALIQHAIAYLRLAEVQNCVHCRTGESCILPIQGSGIHEKTEGAEQAVERLTEALAREPDNLVAGWLLNVAHMALGSYPDEVPEPFLIGPEKFSDRTEFPRFTNVASEWGVDTMSLSGGAIADDFDGDGTIDLLVSDWSTSGTLRIFFNDGRGGFVERTEEAGFVGLYGGLNMVQADYDNDGKLDVFILRGAWKAEQGRHANSLLRNIGNGRFRDVTRDVGLADVHYPTQTAAWADYDLDGDLDLVVGNEDFPCQLFQNDGKGQFHDVARKAGVENNRYTKAVVWGDYDNDGYPDIYVSNYDAPNRLYHNNRDGTFTDVAEQAGVEGPLKSFPAWFWDVNNDGALDLFVASYPMDMAQLAAEYYGQPVNAEADRLYLGDGSGNFREAGQAMGLSRVTDPMGSNFGDLDNDGYLDFYLGTGAPPFEFLVPNVMYWNRGGTAFEEITFSGGFGHLQKGHAVAFADFDNNGNLDVFQQMGGAYPGDAFGNALFRNPGFGNHWITVQLVGTASARSAIGARLRLNLEEDGQPRSIHRWVNSGGSFGCNPLRQHIGLGSAHQIESIEITWPATGKIQTLRGVDIDQAIRITEGEEGFVNL